MYWEGIPTARASTSKYFKIYPKKHPTYWAEALVRLLPDLKDYDPHHFPRGRVVFSKQEGIYRLLADKCILANSGLIKKILSEMRFAESEVKLSWDIDCECALCKSERTSHKDYKDRAVDEEFKTTEDGGKLFFPWKCYRPWKNYRGYIVPSDKEYERLHRGQSRWLKVVLPVAIFNGFLIFNRTHDITGSAWIAVGTMLLSAHIPFVVSYFLWLRTQCRGLKQTAESGFYFSGIGPRETHETSTIKEFGFVMIPILMAAAVWVVLGCLQDLSTVPKHSS